MARAQYDAVISSAMVAEDYDEKLPSPRVHSLSSTLKRRLPAILMASFMVLLIIGVILSGIFSFKNNFKVEERHDLNAVIQAIVSGENSPPPLNDDSANSSTSDLAVVALVDLTDFQPNGSPLVSFNVIFALNVTTNTDIDIPTTCVGAVDPLSNDVNQLSVLTIDPSTSELGTNITGSMNSSASGFLSRYPFDRYTSQILLFAAATSNPNGTCDFFDVDNLIPIRFSAATGQSLQGFSATVNNTKSLNDPTNTTFLVNLTIHHSTIKFFALLSYPVLIAFN